MYKCVYNVLVAPISIDWMLPCVLVNLVLCGCCFIIIIKIVAWCMESPNGFQDVVFLPSRISSYKTFLSNCGGGNA